MSAYVPREAIARMFDEAPCDWWRFVGCSTCNAHRQEPCMATDGPARGPHAARRRSALTLHGTLWLLANGFGADVLGEDA
jgi:hypothetical protein